MSYIRGSEPTPKASWDYEQGLTLKTQIYLKFKSDNHSDNAKTNNNFHPLTLELQDTLEARRGVSYPTKFRSCGIWIKKALQIQIMFAICFPSTRCKSI